MASGIFGSWFESTAEWGCSSRNMALRSPRELLGELNIGTGSRRTGGDEDIPPLLWLLRLTTPPSREAAAGTSEAGLATLSAACGRFLLRTGAGILTIARGRPPFSLTSA